MGGNGKAALPAARNVRPGRGVLNRDDWQAINVALRLSPRQFQVVQHLFEDLSEAQIALSLGISRHTVHTYIKQIYAKLGVSTRGEMLIRAFAEVLAARDARCRCNRTHRPAERDELPVVQVQRMQSPHRSVPAHST